MKKTGQAQKAQRNKSAVETAAEPTFSCKTSFSPTSIFSQTHILKYFLGLQNVDGGCFRPVRRKAVSCINLSKSAKRVLDRILSVHTHFIIICFLFLVLVPFSLLSCPVSAASGGLVGKVSEIPVTILPYEQYASPTSPARNITSDEVPENIADTHSSTENSKGTVTIIGNHSSIIEVPSDDSTADKKSQIGTEEAQDSPAGPTKIDTAISMPTSSPDESGFTSSSGPTPKRLEDISVETTEKGVAVSAQVAESGKALSIVSAGDKTFIEIGDSSASTTEKVVVEENGLSIASASGVPAKSMPVLPDSAAEIAVQRIGSGTVERMSISLENDSPVYTLECKKNAKLFAFIPLQVGITAKVDGVTGDVMEINEPWWAVFAWG